MKLSRASFALAPALALTAFLVASPVFAQDEPPPSSAGATYTETRLSALEEQMRALNGRVEQIEYAAHRLDQTLQRMQSDNDARFTRLEAAQAAAAAAPPPQPVPLPITTPAQQTAPQQPQQPAVDPTGTLGALKMQNGKITGGTINPQSTPLPQVPADYGLTPDEQYERAFALMRQADYPDAEQAFKNFIDANPKDKLLDNAKYWYGETLYVRARFDEAAVAFADAYQQNPQGGKAPDSLLKLAMSLGALNKTPDACVTLHELKAKYPNAPAALKTRAEDERTRLKCPAR